MSSHGLWAAVMAALLLLAGSGQGSQAGELAAGVALGAESGFGAHAQGILRDFTRDVPLSARLTLGYHRAAAGDPLAARRIFINDNTNGTPEDSARYFQVRFDLMYPVWQLGGQPVYLFGGARLARYRAEFVYVGGNEDFEVTTDPWGVGLGLETVFAVNDRSDFLIQVGIDHFLAADLSGHDTTYAPDGVNINPRDGYDYDLADEAVDQPRTELLVMAGLQIRL